MHQVLNRVSIAASSRVRLARVSERRATTHGGGGLARFKPRLSQPTAVEPGAMVIAAFVITCFACGTECRCADGVDGGMRAAVRTIRMQSGPYCGVYSLTAATSALGQPLPLGDLTSRRYIGSELGSSGAELVDAARHHGLRADFVTGLSEWDLRASECPLVLRISIAERRDVFNHWVAYLGEEAGRARILDYPDPVMLYPFGELLSRWDGSAVLVSRGDSSASRLIWLSRLRVAFVILAGWLAVFLSAKVAGTRARSEAPGRWRGGRSIRADLLALSVAAVSVAVCIDLLRPGGLLRNTQVANAIATADGVAALPTLRAADVRKALDAGEERLPVIVDARLPRDYVRGHIPRAINIPAWATASSRQASISSIPKAADVIIYCQGPGCSYDDDIAAQFVAEGFRHVSLFPGGLEEWNMLPRPPSHE